MCLQSESFAQAKPSSTACHAVRAIAAGAVPASIGVVQSAHGWNWWRPTCAISAHVSTSQSRSHKLNKEEAIAPFSPLSIASPSLSTSLLST